MDTFKKCKWLAKCKSESFSYSFVPIQSATALMSTFTNRASASCQHKVSGGKHRLILHALQNHEIHLSLFFPFFFVIPMLNSKQIHFCRGRLMLHQISGLMRIRWVVQFCCSFTHYASRSWRYCSLEQNTTLLLVVVSFCSATASAVCPVLTS